MTGGSLEESKEALAIAETDGVYQFLYLPNNFFFFFVLFIVIDFVIYLIYMTHKWVFIGWFLVLLQEGFSVQWGCTQPDAKLIIFLWTPLVIDCISYPCLMDWSWFFILALLLGIRRQWGSRQVFSGSYVISERGSGKRQGVVDYKTSIRHFNFVMLGTIHGFWFCIHIFRLYKTILLHNISLYNNIDNVGCAMRISENFSSDMLF